MQVDLVDGWLDHVDWLHGFCSPNVIGLKAETHVVKNTSIHIDVYVKVLGNVLRRHDDLTIDVGLYHWLVWLTFLRLGP